MPTSRARARLTRRGRFAVVVLVLLGLGAGGWAAVGRGTAPETTATEAPTPTETEPPPVHASVRAAVVESATDVVQGGPEAAVLAAVRALVQEAPVVVVADAETATAAGGVARRLRVPLLPVTDGLREVLDALGTEVVVAVVPVAAPAHTSPGTEEATASSPEGDLPDVGDREVRRVVVDGGAVDRSAIADVRPADAPAPDSGPLVLLPRHDPAATGLGALALAVGARLVPVAGQLAGDPTAWAVLRSAGDRPWAVAGTESAWVDQDRALLGWDVRVVQSGAELPGGGLRVFPGRRLVALYGSPGAAVLGVLGEQPVDAAVERARQLAGQYAALVDEPVVPTFEIITTIASGGPEPTGDYSRRVPIETIEPWVDAAAAAGVYVILDLQPGRTDFLTQAKEYESLLRRPHVGLALDPEWRLKPDQVHLRQIGSVGVDEVQAVADWLADLTRRDGLPQKLLLLHQFRLSMLPDRAQLAVPVELAVAIQMDGQGSQGAKLETWRAVTTLDPPTGVWFGWKNFYDEDTELRSPADTLAVEPSPVLVSYQ